MEIKSLLHASGHLVLAGKKGFVHKDEGHIFIADHAAPIHGLDEHLYLLLIAAVDTLGLVVGISSTDGGQHVPGSRHFSGHAVDINRVGAAGSVWRQCALKNPHALKLVDFLRHEGVRIGEDGDQAGLLFGPDHSALNPSSLNHDAHIHVSIAPIKR